ncbi:hypothetical protein K432DRAFT_185987 [Lepidopterella palustris CBS 459.81]|uniref:Uncharacterized protein n=1 Tax=Lepidopterella palustris CBS 459.81 TaxID=1314670 RepID=A0A8E2EL65_9PEZI|nr:hypothetical protein K432DRAFT_185987 [Lepidopterella palustris CBS 459.81]
MDFDDFNSVRPIYEREMKELTSSASQRLRDSDQSCTPPMAHSTKDHTKRRIHQDCCWQSVHREDKRAFCFSFLVSPFDRSFDLLPLVAVPRISDADSSRHLGLDCCTNEHFGRYRRPARCSSIWSRALTATSIKTICFAGFLRERVASLRPSKTPAGWSRSSEPTASHFLSRPTGQSSYGLVAYQRLTSQAFTKTPLQDAQITPRIPHQPPKPVETRR